MREMLDANRERPPAPATARLMASPDGGADRQARCRLGRQRRANPGAVGRAPYAQAGSLPATGGITALIFIVVKFRVQLAFTDSWLSIVADYTEATRAEPGNLFFEWSRSVDDPDVFVLVEAFADQAAGIAHMQGEHVKTGMARMAEVIADTPELVNVEAAGSGWSRMAEITPTAPR